VHVARSETVWYIQHIILDRQRSLPYQICLNSDNITEEDVFVSQHVVLISTDICSTACTSGYSTLTGPPLNPPRQVDIDAGTQVDITCLPGYCPSSIMKAFGRDATARAATARKSNYLSVDVAGHQGAPRGNLRTDIGYLHVLNRVLSFPSGQAVQAVLPQSDTSGGGHIGLKT
jgi:hypothetical protein